MQLVKFTEMHVKWSVILANPFDPEMLEINVLHRMRVHRKIPG